MQNNSSSPAFIIRRIAAFLYDSLLLIAVFFVVTSIAIAFNEGNAIENHAFKLVLYAVGFLFFSWFWKNGGQTLGMQAWRIKVISESGDTLTYKQCFQRYLSATFLFGISLIAAMFNSSGKAWHDSLSNTKIVFINK